MILCVRDFILPNGLKNIPLDSDRRLYPSKRILNLPEDRIWDIASVGMRVEASSFCGENHGVLFSFNTSSGLRTLWTIEHAYPERYRRNEYANMYKYESEESSRLAELLAKGIPEYLDFSPVQDQLLIKYEFFTEDFFNRD